MCLVSPTVAESVARSGRLTAEFQASEPGLLTDMLRVQLVGGDADSHCILRLQCLRACDEASRPLSVTAPFAVAVGEVDEEDLSWAKQKLEQAA